MSASINSVPPEIWLHHYPVASVGDSMRQQQERQDLSSLLRTCRRLRTNFEPVIYKTIAFNTPVRYRQDCKYVALHAQYAVRLLLLLRTLRCRPSLGALILDFSTDVEDRAMSCHEHEARASDFYCALYEAFPAGSIAPELKSSSLLGNSVGGKKLFEVTLETLCSYMPNVQNLKLQRFSDL